MQTVGRCYKVSANISVAVNLVFCEYVTVGHFGVGLKRVAAPRCVIPVITIPVLGSVAWVEGKGYPTAVFAFRVVRYAVCDVIFSGNSCCVCDKNIVAV